MMSGQDLFNPPYDFQAGAALLVNKPLEWTSFDVVNKIRFKLRYKLGVKKIKVGHAGTLDPLATGLLLICTGRATKKLNDFQGMDKTYTGTITLGATTPSYDLETEFNQTFPTEHITPKLVEKTRESFIGELAQLPPVYSAIKKDGRPMYKKARAGIKVEIEPRNIFIHHFNFTRIELPHLHFEVHCSKGTYIRSLAFDFGKALGSGGHLSALCRTKIGNYSLKNAWELENLTDYIENL